MSLLRRFDDTQVLITGASAGIGRALAEVLARPGITLGLVARRTERLEEISAELQSRGARVFTYTADVTDAERMAEVGLGFAGQAGGVTHVIANAGISRGDQLSAGVSGQMAEIIAINVQGVIHTLAPLIPGMMARGRGHLIAIGSMAGFRGLPDKAAYCASKAAVKTLMDGFRPMLRRHGIRVTTICPGWVESEMTADNPYPMPFKLPADRAARLILKAIARGRRTYILPWQMRLAAPLLSRVPDWMLPTF